MFRDSAKQKTVYRDLSPVEVKEILKNKNGTRLIDVREEWEYKIAHLENSELMPLSNFMHHIESLKEDNELIIYCHRGVRSANVCMFLAGKGFRNLINLRGGIEAWSNEVDKTVPRY
jgi:rhodanese-related sulfurtransferase